jgi:hypothetical protein
MVCDLFPWFAEPRSGTAFCGGGDISWPPLPQCHVHQASAFPPQSTKAPNMTLRFPHEAILLHISLAAGC